MQNKKVLIKYQVLNK